MSIEEDRLQALARATDDVRPSEDFLDAVMKAVEDERLTPAPVETLPTSGRGWREGVVNRGRVAVALAALAAGTALLVSAQAQSDLDETVISSVEIVEVAE